MSITTQHKGNIFNSKAEVIAVTVNCVGFMGKGMALECALRFPEVESEYKAACKEHLVKTGFMFWPQAVKNPNLVLFPTKNDYKFPSKISYIREGLESLCKDLSDRKLSSIALPKLGTELGGLDWKIVEKEILLAFESFVINLEIWSYDSNIKDPQVEKILQLVEKDFTFASEFTGLNENILKRLIRAKQNSTFAGFADLLKIEGVGKQSAKKLISLSRASFEKEPSLFD